MAGFSDIVLESRVASELKAGDILHSVDGESVDSAGAGYKALHRIRASATVDLTRDGSRISFQVRPEDVVPSSVEIRMHPLPVQTSEEEVLSPH